MKLIINYDFFNAVRDVNEGFTPFKIIRNKKNKWIKCNIPILTFLYYLGLGNNFLKHLPSGLCLYYTLEFGMEFVQYKLVGDIYKNEAIDKLRQLSYNFQNLNINTSYDLIKKSTCYSVVHNLQLNKNKIPQIVESKYILVPYYNMHNNIKDASILQEHVIGSSTYILSCATPKKEHKLVYNI